jgi:hypothetical protein
VCQDVFVSARFDGFLVGLYIVATFDALLGVMSSVLAQSTRRFVQTWE